MESIGARLKKIRLEKGLSLEEAQKKTTATLKTLGINPGDCIEYPDGSMVLLPKKKEN